LPALLGRLVLRGVWDVRKHDSQQTFVSLGGQNGLRGYPAQRFYAFGGSKILGNVEYRSEPWLLQSVHLGVVAFYDVGAVYRALSNLRVHHDVGAGLRVLFPQLNRTVFRLDFGVPLDAKGVSIQMTYGSEPIVTLTAAEDLAAQADDAAGLRQGL
jgi:hemolysin activation/secretion protein